MYPENTLQYHWLSLRLLSPGNKYMGSEFVFFQIATTSQPMYDNMSSCFVLTACYNVL